VFIGGQGPDNAVSCLQRHKIADRTENFLASQRDPSILSSRADWHFNKGLALLSVLWASWYVSKLLALF
jgi:hypothetical protein